MANIFSYLFEAREADPITPIARDLAVLNGDFKLIKISGVKGAIGIVCRGQYQPGVIVVCDDDDDQIGISYVVLPRMNFNAARAWATSKSRSLSDEDSEHFSLAGALNALAPKKEDRHRRR